MLAVALVAVHIPTSFDRTDLLPKMIYCVAGGVNKSALQLWAHACIDFTNLKH